MAQFVNFDILKCEESGTVWLYLGNKYYNLSISDRESHARSSIASQYGTPTKISNIRGIGDEILGSVTGERPSGIHKVYEKDTKFSHE